MLEKLPEAVGHALREQRAGLDHIVFNRIDLRAGMAAIALQSLAFADHAPIPAVYTADGVGASPPLHWSGIPIGAHTLVLVVEDADAPTARPLVHAIVVGLSPHDEGLPEGALEHPEKIGDDGVKTGRNSYLQTGWLPPDPPPGHGVHRYCFQIFALAEGAAFAGTPGREQVVQALRERALASGLLIGTYARPDGSIQAGEPAGQPLAGVGPSQVGA